MRNTVIIMDAHSQSINCSIDIPLITVNFRFKVQIDMEMKMGKQN